MSSLFSRSFTVVAAMTLFSTLTAPFSSAQNSTENTDSLSTSAPSPTPSITSNPTPKPITNPYSFLKQDCSATTKTITVDPDTIWYANFGSHWRFQVAGVKNSSDYGIAIGGVAPYELTQKTANGFTLMVDSPGEGLMLVYRRDNPCDYFVVTLIVGH